MANELRNNLGIYQLQVLITGNETVLDQMLSHRAYISVTFHFESKVQVIQLSVFFSASGIVSYLILSSN